MKQLIVTIEGKKWLSPLRSARFAEMSLSELQKQNVAQESVGLKNAGTKRKSHISQERLREVLDYNQDTGIFTRKIKTGPRAKVGDIVGCLDVSGYLRISIDGNQYWAQRLAWIYVNGDDIGNAKIEHINKNRADNRICNLRLSTEVLNEKMCSKCRTVLPATNEYFYADKSMKLGFSSICKKCSGNKGKRARYLGNGLKICSKCKSVLKANEENFNKNKSSLDGLRPDCKKCQAEFRKNIYKLKKAEMNEKSKHYYDKNKEKHNEKSKQWRQKNKGVVRYHQRKYKYLKRRAIPSWFEHEKVLIEKVYEMAGVLGMQVDHIVPINSKLVCGLHCWHNLQLLAPSENRSKSNSYWPDMP
jgi:hypothetical protein